MSLITPAEDSKQKYDKKSISNSIELLNKIFSFQIQLTYRHRISTILMYSFIPLINGEGFLYNAFVN